MAEPEFDRSTGWWFIRYRTGKGTRVKKTLRKDERWTRGGPWPGAKRPKAPADVLVRARPFQDIDTAAKLGHAVTVPRQTPLSAFLEAYRASYALAQKPKSAKQLAYAIRTFEAYCAKAKVAAVEQVTRQVCREFMEDLAKQGMAFNTIGGIRGVLGGAFKRAVEDEILLANPWHQLKTPGKDDSPGTPSWTPEAVEAMKKQLRGWVREMFIVGINSGFRSTALLNLEWRDVQWTVARKAYGRLICRKELSKSGRAYSVPLVGELHDVLAKRHREQKDTRPTSKVFPGRIPGKGFNPSSFRDAIESACREAGIEFPGSAWHSMRTTFATTAHAKGVNPRAIQAWMNHASIQMTDKYSHYSEDLDESEATKLDSD